MVTSTSNLQYSKVTADDLSCILHYSEKNNSTFFTKTHFFSPAFTLLISSLNLIQGMYWTNRGRDLTLPPFWKRIQRKLHSTHILLYIMYIMP